jgi:glutamate carboxypeptidase
MASSRETPSDPVAWLAGQHDAMIEALRRMVDTDGGSYDKAGVDAVGAQVREFMQAQGIPVEVLPQQKHGDCLRALVNGAAEGQPAGNARRNIVLMGHRDTVFPKGEPQRRPFRIEAGRAYGPGVCDMKAGIVMNMFVLAAFHKFGGAPGPLVGLFTGDEEIGSPEGRPVIEAEARGARAVFNSEPGRPNGGVVTGRKGGVFMVMEVEGKAAHSGGSFEAGISAIGELAQKITAIHALTDLGRGITLNVGLISGGQSVNTVAPWARVARSFVPGTRATLAIKGEFLPLTQDEAAARLYATYVEAATATGFATSGEFSGGCADSGFTAAMGAPTLCSVGPVGGKAHSPEEYLEVDSFVPRAQALARAILKLDATGL